MSVDCSKILTAPIFMGHLAFGMLQNNEQPWAIELLHKGNEATWLDVAYLALSDSCFAIPGASGDLVHDQEVLLPKAERENGCR